MASLWTGVESVNETLPDEIRPLFRSAMKTPLVALDSRPAETVLDRRGIEAILPHRDPFLLIDRVTRIDAEEGLVVACYDLSRAQEVFQGHFPEYPVWPGVLQVEAIGQAGILLYLRRGDGASAGRVTLTHILAARFMHPVTPGGEVEIVARTLEDGLFFIVVGQCFQNGNICSVAAIRGF